jgi:putative GTP pyrophosphokinase
MHDSLIAQYVERQPLLESLRTSLEAETQSALLKCKHIDRVSFRVKGLESFVAKARDRRTTPAYQDPLVEIEDQIAGRVIVFFLSDMDVVVGRLKGTFGTIERKHMRPARDEEFSYESFHLICLIPPHLKPDGWDARHDLPPTFELQVRTVFMHAYAEPQHDLGYKAASELPREIRRELAWIAASAWGGDQAFERVRKWSSTQETTGVPQS